MANKQEPRCLEDTVEQGRSHKLTERAIEEKLQRHIALRKHNLGALTSKIWDVETMKRDAQNLKRVKKVIGNYFALNLQEFSTVKLQIFWLKMKKL